MNHTHDLAFTVFPYLCLTVFGVGHAYRYVTDRYAWNARSSEFLEKNELFYGAVIFHWGILLTLAGHAGGLLIPQRLFDLAGIHSDAHLLIAYWTGLLVGVAAVVGSLLLLKRRLSNARVKAAGTVNDVVTIGALTIVGGLGLFNVVFGHHNVLYTVAPWIRGIVTFRPDATLMLDVPLSYKMHILSALALLAFSPFSRLVHIWSTPLGFAWRANILFRRCVPEGEGGMDQTP